MIELEPQANNELPRAQFIDKIIWPNVRHRKVLEAFKKVDRGLFVPEGQELLAYKDVIVDIAENSTLSQPSLMADMIDHLELNGRQRVLEVGTGTGYTAAVLSNLSYWVDTIELNPVLAERARVKLYELDCTNVKVHAGDGACGLPGVEFDAIVVMASAKAMPQMLVDQLADGGRIVVPVGDPKEVRLCVGVKEGEEVLVKELQEVHFIPLVSNYPGGWKSYSEYQKAMDKVFAENGNEFSMFKITKMAAEILGVGQTDMLSAFDWAMDTRRFDNHENQKKLQLNFKSIDQTWDSS